MKSKKALKVFTPEELEQQLLKRVKKGPNLLSDLAKIFKKSQDKIVQMVDSLREQGYDIKVTQRTEKGEFIYEVKFFDEPQVGPSIRLESTGRTEIKIGFISDTCFGLKTHQPELLALALKEFKRRKMGFVIHCGNIVGGKPTKSNGQDFLGGGFDEQIDFTSEIPKMPFKIYFLNGPRDLTHAQDVAHVLCQDRKNWRKEGDLEANFYITGSKGEWKIKVMHLKKGSPYTVSYPTQKVKENFTAAIRYMLRKSHRPNLLILGGLSTPLVIPAKKPGDMINIALPGLCATPPSQEAEIKKGNVPELGYTIVTIKLDKGGNPIDVEWEFNILTAYEQVEQCYYTPQSSGDHTNIPLNEAERDILRELQERPKRLGELSRKLNLDKGNVVEVIQSLQKKKYRIAHDEAAKKYVLKYDWTSRRFEPISLTGVHAKKLIIASISDTHIGDKTAREDLIERAYQEAKLAKADVMTHSGDVFTGTNAYKGQQFDLKYHGADEQLERAQKIWPDSKIPLKVIGGSSHEKAYSVLAGYNIVKMFARLQKNVEYIGGEFIVEGTTTINGVTIRLVHPKGGIPYGKSYRSQRFIETLVEEQSNSEDGVRVLLLGHLHVSIFMHYKGISSFLVPCLEGSTSYLKERGMVPWLGMWITEITLDRKNNVTRVRPKYISFEEEIKSE
ncbi:MAG: hypothetical protein PHE59_00885 [Patescibacteria group bacterium]|nr:hypothetical protein [Patescibacteria group bacterium]MDD5164709.1 hypothetical protein [Patescibacteria group bacterium]MDD5534185.1 hypothetical protein [Patescibacteria group bacterium]